jgi:hypothetical protein
LSVLARQRAAGGRAGSTKGAVEHQAKRPQEDPIRRHSPPGKARALSVIVKRRFVRVPLARHPMHTAVIKPPAVGQDLEEETGLFSVYAVARKRGGHRQ